MAQSKQSKKIQIELRKKGKGSLTSTKLDINNLMGYNVKLRKKEIIQNARLTTLKNGKPAVKGVGSDGTKMVRFIKNN